MEVITFDRFEGGIDLRKAEQVSDANRLVECKNAYITTGWAIKKRPGLDKISVAARFPPHHLYYPREQRVYLFLINRCTRVVTTLCLPQICQYWKVMA